MGDLEAFLEAASVPRDQGHATGDLAAADTILARSPELARSSLHAAAALGDDDAVRRELELDPSRATATAGPRGWDALTHLCFSRYLRLDPSRSDGFVRAARALLDAGADPNTGWWEPAHRPDPEWEPALYGAAGIAHHPELTALLLERGADPNDGEVVYHTPESYDNRALRLLLATGRLTPESLSVMLVRKHDWHDPEGIRLLLEHGADPNRPWAGGVTPLHHAIRRGNRSALVELLLEAGADPRLEVHGRSAVAEAARHGRGDLLLRFEARGVDVELGGADRIAAACARGDADGARALSASDPTSADALRAQAATVLRDFTCAGNADGVAALLDLGVAVDTPCAADGYWDIAPGATALHVAAWRAAHETVALLVAREASVDATDGRGRTPLTLAVRAGVDSWWAEGRAPDSVRTLLDAGASPGPVPFPTGWEAVDALLRRHGVGG